MSKKREKLDVIFDILEIVKNHNNSIKPTPLLRLSNLSFNSFNQYQEELVAKKFMIELEDKKGKKFYSLTNKGFEFLDKYISIKKVIEEFEL